MTTPIPLRDYQVADLTYFFSEDRCGSLSDPGTGKTGPACLYTWARWQEGDRAVWLQPKSLVRKNYDELLRFTPFGPGDLVVLDGTPNKRHELIRRGAAVFLTTPETFAKHWPELQARWPDTQLVVSDEFHAAYKLPTSQRSRALLEFLKKCRYFIAMTGTLINGRLDSAYMFAHIVGPTYYFNHDAFLRQHALTDPFTGKILGWRNHAKVAAILGRHAIRRTLADVFGPEAVVREIERVQMATTQRARYDELHDKALIALDDGGILESGSPLSLARAILEHPEAVPRYETDPETGKRRRTGEFVDLMKGELCGKDERLLVHVEDHVQAGTPFVVFAALVKQQERLRDLIAKRGVKVGFINGGVTGAARVRVDEDFRAGRIQAIVCSAATAGLGFNWMYWNGREVGHCIFASLDYLDSSVTQAERRFTRGTRTTPLRVTVLEYERSIDQRIFSLVQENSETAHAVDATREVLRLKS